MAKCGQQINFASVKRVVIEGRGFGRRKLRVYECPSCGATHRMIDRTSGGFPPGAFICGAEYSTPPPSCGI